MRRKPLQQRLGPGHAPSPRIAWWAAFLTTVALIAILNIVRADAATLPGSAAPPRPAAFEPEEEEQEQEEDPFEEEDEGEELGAECDPEEEAEGACAERAEEEAEEEWPPRECLLNSTDAAVAAFPQGRRVRLTVRYSARASTQVAISYRLSGPRGALKMDDDRRRFTGAGSFRETEYLSAAQMTRALAAKTFTVEIRPLSAPRYCHVYFDHRLSVKRASAHGPVWLDDETSFRVPGRR